MSQVASPAQGKSYVCCRVRHATSALLDRSLAVSSFVKLLSYHRCLFAFCVSVFSLTDNECSPSP
ncbi:hypothetical protein C8Q80DRAFT_1213751 [Daedaleopsis nitida]|nr:hypothetical protein C8Q80DRAFT_1213751 [Daedaleopsis nitida]